MKTVSGPMASHLLQDTTTIATCWKVTRTDGNVYSFTDHDQDLIVSGVTYLASDSYTRTALKTDQTLGVDNLNVIGMLDNSQISDVDLRNGLYDYAQVEMFVVNWRDLTQGIVRLRQGWLGEVVRSPTGTFEAELRGLTQALSYQFGDLLSPVCRADLGDSKCKFNLAAVSGTSTVTGVTNNKTFACTALTYAPYSTLNAASIIVKNTMTSSALGLGVQITVNGTPTTFAIPFGSNAAAAITFLTAAINAASIGVTAGSFFATTEGVSLSLNDPVHDTATVIKLNDLANDLTIDSFSDGYFDGGVVTWLTGNNTGATMEIKTYTAANSQLILFLSMKGTIQVGDTFTYSPGCDKRRETCYWKFQNMINFRGEPDLPGMDAVLTYPEAFQG